MSPSQPKIAVVGAGPAGIAAAYRLRHSGAAVTVFEALGHVGGRTRTDIVDGYRIDTGAQLFASEYTEFLRGLQAFGGAALAVPSAGRDALWKHLRAHEVVYGSSASMLAFGALSLSTKLRLGTTYVPFLRQNAHALHPHAFERAAAAGLDRESVTQWGAREMGAEFVEILAYPLLASFYGTVPEEASAALYHSLALQGSSIQLFALQGGAAGFCEAGAGWLRANGAEVRLSKGVTRVRVAGQGVELYTEEGGLHFDGAVIAVPAPAAVDLLSERTEAAAWLRRVIFRPTVTLALLLDRPAGVRYFGLSFPRSEARSVAAVCVQENKIPGLVPRGKGLLVVIPTPETGARLAKAEPGVVLDALLPEVARALPGIDAAIDRARVYRWPHAWAVFRTGHSAHLAEFRTGRVEGAAPIALAGDYLHAPTLEGAALSGARAAVRLLDRCAAVDAHRLR